MRKTTGTRDLLTFPAVAVKYLALRVIRSAGGRPTPMLEEIRGG